MVGAGPTGDAPTTSEWSTSFCVTSCVLSQIYDGIHLANCATVKGNDYFIIVSIRFWLVSFHWFTYTLTLETKLNEWFKDSSVKIIYKIFWRTETLKNVEFIIDLILFKYCWSDFNSKLFYVVLLAHILGYSYITPSSIYIWFLPWNAVNRFKPIWPHPIIYVYVTTPGKDALVFLSLYIRMRVSVCEFQSVAIVAIIIDYDLSANGFTFDMHCIYPDITCVYKDRRNIF